MKNLKIRLASLSDCEIITDFSLALAKESEDLILDRKCVLNGVKRGLENPAFARYYLAEVSGEIVGQTMLTFELSDWFDGINWWIQSVYVLPNFRNKGIFKSLYDFIREQAKADGNIRRLRLYVEKENDSAIECYKALGMKKLAYDFYQDIVA